MALNSLQSLVIAFIWLFLAADMILVLSKRIAAPANPMGRPLAWICAGVIVQLIVLLGDFSGSGSEFLLLMAPWMLASGWGLWLYHRAKGHPDRRALAAAACAVIPFVGPLIGLLLSPTQSVKCEGCGEMLDERAVEFCEKCRTPVKPHLEKSSAPPFRYAGVSALAVWLGFIFLAWAQLLGKGSDGVLLPVAALGAIFVSAIAYVFLKKRRWGYLAAFLVVTVFLQTIGLGSFADLYRKMNEGAGKGNLEALRSALSIYHEDNKGKYPMNLSALAANGMYVEYIFPAKIPFYHHDSSAVRNGKVSDDSGGWLYDNVPGDADFGKIWVNCTHTDTRGTAWSSY